MKLNFFSPVTLSYVNLIIRPAKEPRREGKNVPPLHQSQAQTFTALLTNCLGSISSTNLLEQFIELRETFCLLDY